MTTLSSLAEIPRERVLVETQPSTPLGTTGATLNGRIQPRGLPTRYWFEYGPTSSYGQTSVPTALPPQREAYLSENWESGQTSGWGGGMSGKDLQVMKDPDTGRAFVRFSEPSADDPNHVDGVGTLHLSKYFYSGTVIPRRGGTAFLGGGEPDFRDARVSLSVRGHHFQPNGAELLWWTQRMIDSEIQDTNRWECTNWAYTGFTLTDKLKSGVWEKVSYELKNDSRLWAYSGNNLTQERPERYVYAPLDASLGNINADFFHLLAFVDPKHRPTGAIDFAEIALVYRNYSLLRGANGGRLVQSSAAGEGTAEHLTDGWRHGPERMWASVANPQSPLEFIYELAPGASAHTVMLHQNTEWPAREVEVLLSDDGSHWTRVLQASLPEASPLGANFNFVRERFTSRAARWVQVRILSGYRSLHWGLGEIEVFGSGATWATDDDWYHVNVDLSGLAPGTEYHYRLIAESSQGRWSGPDHVFITPATSRPVIVTGEARRMAANSAQVQGELTSLGLPTEYHFEYGHTPALGSRTETFYGGRLETPRPVYVRLEGLQPNTIYHYRLVAKNAAGEVFGREKTFKTLSARE